MSERERLSDAIWKVMHGYDGRLLSGDFYPGHDAIVDAAMSALKDASPLPLPEPGEGNAAVADSAATRGPTRAATNPLQVDEES